MMYSREMERVNKFMDRLKVPGGWLVHTSNYDTGTNESAISEALCFFPDPKYEWDLQHDQGFDCRNPFAQHV